MSRCRACGSRTLVSWCYFCDWPLPEWLFPGRNTRILQRMDPPTQTKEG